VSASRRKGEKLDSLKLPDSKPSQIPQLRTEPKEIELPNINEVEEDLLSRTPRNPNRKLPKVVEDDIVHFKRVSHTLSPISFLFCVNQLVINDEPTSGGAPPRVNANGRWLPPLESRGYYPPRPGVVFRWSEGDITVADGFQWYNGGCWSPNGYATPYRATSIFYCNRFTQMLTANGDASLRNFETSNHPDNRWWPLTFLHDRALSRVTESGDEQDLAGTGGAWINQLGLWSNRNEDRRAPVSTGLAGNLATIIGLIALSCQEGKLQTILQAGAWDHTRWRGHKLPHGREFRSIGLSINIISLTYCRF